MTPAPFAMQFWIPTQRPAADEPAMAWETAKMFGLMRPSPIEASTSQATDQPALDVTQPSRQTATHTDPTPSWRLRTTVGDAPAAMLRSPSHPAQIVASARTTYAPPPISAIRVIDQWRDR